MAGFVDSIRSKFNKEGEFRIDNEDALVRIHHILMKEYGWIPLDQFRSSEEVTVTEYEFPIIIPKPWHKPWLWKLSTIKFKAKSVKKKEALPMGTIWNLIACISEDKEAERKAMEKNKPRRR